MYLNGWRRLWVVLSIFYLLTVIGVGVYSFPNESNVSFAKITKFLSIKSLKILSNNNDPDEKFNKLTIVEKTKYFQHLTMPSKTPKEDVKEVIADYEKATDSVISDEVGTHLIGLLIIFFIPIATVYGLGFSISWVKKGFIKQEAAI